METNTATPVAIAPPRADLTAEERRYIPKIDPHYVPNQKLMEHILLDIAERLPIMLTGHAGTSKTSTIEQLAAVSNQPFLRMNMNGQSSVSDFVGYNTAIDGSVEWVDGGLPWCMRRGIWCCIDEFDFGDPDVLSVLNSVTEPNGKLVLKEKGRELVEPHPSFRLFATANTVGCMEEFRHIYQGANIMNSALLDRFQTYQTTYLPHELEIKVLRNKVPDCPEDAATALVNLATSIREGFTSSTLDKTFSIRSLISLAKMLVRLREMEMNKPKGEKPLTPKGFMNEVIKLSIFPKVSQKDAMAIKAIAVSMDIA